MLLCIVRMHIRRSQLARYQLMSVDPLLYEHLLLFVHQTLQTHHENLALVLMPSSLFSICLMITLLSVAGPTGLLCQD